MTESDQPASSLLRTDTLGRPRTARERREELLDEFEKSGLSGARFAAMIGVRYQTFAGWRRRRRKEGLKPSMPAANPGSGPRLVEAVVEEPDRGGRDVLRIGLPGGAVLELRHRRQVPLAVEFLKALAGAC